MVGPRQGPQKRGSCAQKTLHWHILSGLFTSQETDSFMATQCFCAAGLLCPLLTLVVKGAGTSMLPMKMCRNHCRCRGALLMMSSTLKIISEASVADNKMACLTCKSHRWLRRNLHPVRMHALGHDAALGPANHLVQNAACIQSPDNAASRGLVRYTDSHINGQDYHCLLVILIREMQLK